MNIGGGRASILLKEARMLTIAEKRALSLYLAKDLCEAKDTVLALLEEGGIDALVQYEHRRWPRLYVPDGWRHRELRGVDLDEFIAKSFHREVRGANTLLGLRDHRRPTRRMTVPDVPAPRVELAFESDLGY
jgi:hypothetical protein